MWKRYFSNAISITGIDIDDSCKRFESDKVKVYIGDQENVRFLNYVEDNEGPFDIIIDDGGHTMKQQINTFYALFPKLNNGGIYVIEDLHTSYWKQFGGGVHRRNTTISLIKKMIDEIHFWAINHPRARRSLFLDRLDRYSRKYKIKLISFILDKFVIRKANFTPANFMQQDIKSIHVSDSICFIYKGRIERDKMINL